MSGEGFCTAPMPLERLVGLPAALDGSSGRNRAPGQAQIAANTDLAAIETWLREFVDSPQTERSYRKEAERLLLWAMLECGKPLSGLAREDIQRYQDFLASPTPRERWCGPRAPRYSPRWRPFQGPLSAASQAQALTILNGLFSYLVNAGYLRGNPMGLVKRRLRNRASVRTRSQGRFLEQELWQRVWQHIVQACPQTGREWDRHERIRYLFTLLYMLGARVAELATHTMGSLQEVRGRWWWFVTGKGDKPAKVPVSTECLAAVVRYRQYLGLPPLPRPDDSIALVPSQKGTRPISANMVYRLVKATFAEVAQQLEVKDPPAAHKLRQASTHWMRHTAVTHMADEGLELRLLNRTARHEKLETTMIYLHAEDEHWHDSLMQRRMPSWSGSEND
ncbi:MAG: tyrosine-type recombinase/integrase [Gammaproteobacteria bacterium]|nr:tyrosine-type recombinase/integrase [Gammaproteobacteria bacterium]